MNESNISAGRSNPHYQSNANNTLYQNSADNDVYTRMLEDKIESQRAVRHALKLANSINSSKFNRLQHAS